MCVLYWASCEMLFFVKVLVSGFRTPFALHQVPETLFLNGGIKEFVHLKKRKKKIALKFLPKDVRVKVKVKFELHLISPHFWGGKKDSLKQLSNHDLYHAASDWHLCEKCLWLYAFVLVTGFI